MNLYMVLGGDNVKVGLRASVFYYFIIVIVAKDNNFRANLTIFYKVWKPQSPRT